jgi:nicotinamide mononucleotide transporter
VSSIEWTAAIITAYSIWLATKENVWYWPTGIVSLVLYTWTFYKAHLYGEAGLQIVCLGLMIYGWYEWLRGGENRTELPVSKTPRRAWIGIFGSGLLITASLTLVMRHYTDNPAPLVDASVTSFSIVAQIMTARKWLENWIFWIVINVVSIFLYVNRKLYPTAVLYVVLLVLAIAGYRQWKRSLASA